MTMTFVRTKTDNQDRMTRVATVAQQEASERLRKMQELGKEIRGVAIDNLRNSLRGMCQEVDSSIAYLCQLFGKIDRSNSCTLDAAEFLSFLRKDLKVAPTVLTDKESASIILGL